MLDTQIAPGWYATWGTGAERHYAGPFGLQGQASRYARDKAAAHYLRTGSAIGATCHTLPHHEVPEGAVVEEPGEVSLGLWRPMAGPTQGERDFAAQHPVAASRPLVLVNPEAAEAEQLEAASMARHNRAHEAGREVEG